MDRSSLIILLLALLIPAVPSYADNAAAGNTISQTKKPDAVKPKKYALNILELTNSEMYRYGREMYLSGNYAEAAKAFLDMLRLDCHNKLAHYHLQKIAAADPAYAFLREKLKNSPCGTYDFSREDFLPASSYYEKDPAILLEQLLAYHRQVRLNDKDLAAKLKYYSGLVSALESTIKVLTQGDLRTVGSGSPIKRATFERIEAGRKMAGKIEKEIDFLKNQLASERIDGQKEVQDMRTGVAEAETRTDELASKATREPAYSPAAKALLEAVAKAKAQLEGKEQALAAKDKNLASLQSRFEDIQRRLKAIQIDLIKKNGQIKELETIIPDNPKP